MAEKTLVEIVEMPYSYCNGVDKCYHITFEPFYNNDSKNKKKNSVNRMYYELPFECTKDLINSFVKYLYGFYAVSSAKALPIDKENPFYRGDIIVHPLNKSNEIIKDLTSFEKKYRSNQEKELKVY